MEQSPRRDGRTTDTRARVLEVALELFIAQGFDKTRLQHIADRLDLTKAALYYHFPSKAELIHSLLQPAIDEVDAFLDAAEAQTPPLRRFLEGFFDVIHANRSVFAALMRDASGLAVIGAEGWVERLAERLARVVVGTEPTNAQRVRAVAAASGLSQAAILVGDIPRDELRALCVDTAHATLTRLDPAPGSTTDQVT